MYGSLSRENLLSRLKLSLSLTLCKYILYALELFAYNLKTARAQKMKSKWNRNPMNEWYEYGVYMRVYVCVCVCVLMCVHLERVEK